jgi:hypothetical protein
MLAGVGAWSDQGVGGSVVTVRVDPVSIRRYATRAQQEFDAVRSELVRLVNDAVNVHYFGPNAASFKNHCGEMAAEFAQNLSVDIGKIAEAVQASTNAIAQALGGTPISFSVNGAAIPLPQVPSGDGSVEVDLSALEGLKPVVSQHIGRITGHLDSHLSSLQSTDWMGQAKDTAVSAVSQFTSAAKNRASEAGQSITSYIDSQISAVKVSDR